jgi:hypothetical protein
MFRTLQVVSISSVLTLVAAGAQAAPDPVAIQLPTDLQTVHLGTTLAIPVSLTASSAFDGTVSLSLDLGALSAASPQGRVSVTVSPEQLHLSPGETAPATITVKTDSMAPTVSSVQVGLIAQPSGAKSSKRVSSQFPLAVDSIFEIHLYGGPAPETWDSPKSVSFAPHSEGVLVRFINMDTRDSHVIHSVGPIPHGDTGNPLQPAAAQGQQGGIYEYRVTDTDPEDDIYYCHVHEGDADQRTLHFNQQ